MFWFDAMECLWYKGETSFKNKFLLQLCTDSCTDFSLLWSPDLRAAD